MSQFSQAVPTAMSQVDIDRRLNYENLALQVLNHVIVCCKRPILMNSIKPEKPYCS